MGLTGDEKALADACAISLIRGRAVVVGVRENAEFPQKMSKKCILNAKVYVLIPTLNIAFTVLKIVSTDTYLSTSLDNNLNE